MLGKWPCSRVYVGLLGLCLCRGNQPITYFFLCFMFVERFTTCVSSRASGGFLYYQWG